MRSRKGGARQQRVPIEIEALEGNEYPVLPLRDTVVFPNLVSPLFIGRDRSIRAVEAAEAMDVPLLVVAQRDPEVLDPDLADLYTVGTAVEIGRVLAHAGRQHDIARPGHRARAGDRRDQTAIHICACGACRSTKTNTTTWPPKR